MEKIKEVMKEVNNDQKEKDLYRTRKAQHEKQYKMLCAGKG